MKRLIPALAIVALLITSCSQWTGTGTVTGKTYRESYTYTSTMIVGKVVMPQTHYVPECYELTIRDQVDNKEHSLCFEQTVWDQYEINSNITVEEKP